MSNTTKTSNLQYSAEKINEILEDVANLPETVSTLQNALSGYLTKTDAQDTYITQTQLDDTLRENKYTTETDLESYVLKSSLDAKHYLSSSNYITAGRAANSIVGERSTAEGYNTIASGKYSHAEGISTQATNNQAHAEGSTTKATATCAHAEGYNTTASGSHSHSEGNGTSATKANSHAEGLDTIAGGQNAHAEGKSTQANAVSSHAEGIGTITPDDTKAQGQHVEGKWNEAKADYAHIVGGGSDNSHRKNIYELDWNGNAWFAGEITAKNTTKNAMSCAQPGWKPYKLSVTQGKDTNNGMTAANPIKTIDHFFDMCATGENSGSLEHRLTIVSPGVYIINDYGQFAGGSFHIHYNPTELNQNSTHKGAENCIIIFRHQPKRNKGGDLSAAGENVFYGTHYNFSNITLASPTVNGGSGGLRFETAVLDFDNCILIGKEITCVQCYLAFKNNQIYGSLSCAGCNGYIDTLKIDDTYNAASWDSLTWDTNIATTNPTASLLTEWKTADKDDNNTSINPTAKTLSFKGLQNKAPLNIDNGSCLSIRSGTLTLPRRTGDCNYLMRCANSTLFFNSDAKFALAGGTTKATYGIKMVNTILILPKTVSDSLKNCATTITQQPEDTINLIITKNATL